MTKLLEKDVKIVWSKQCEEASHHRTHIGSTKHREAL
jgi:hypothetical protein